MTSIADLCGKRISLHEDEFEYNDFVGVEQELEHVPAGLFRGVIGVRAERDGSLRGESCEVVSEVTPASKLRYILQAVENTIMDWSRSEDIELEDMTGERTSTHIHLNMTDVDTDVVKNMMIVYLSVEPHIFRSMFPEREPNRFCTPMYSVGPELNPISLRGSKYCAVNLKTLRQFGTIEFRHMGGCVSTESIIKWVKLILRMKHVALNKTRQEILGLIEGGHMHDLLFGVGHGASNDDVELGKYSTFSKLSTSV